MNQKTIQQIQKQVQAAPRPQAPVPQQAAPPPMQEQAHTTAPPVPQAALPLPSAPRPSPSVELPSAPQAKIVPNAQSAHNALQDAMRGALSGPSNADVGGGGSAGVPLHSGAQILSDTKGVDFTAFERKFDHDVLRNWEPLIPEEINPPISKKGIVVLRVTILHDGQIANMVLESPSGDVALDKAAWGAITSEGQFPQLPKDFTGQDIEIRVTFLYNIPQH
jgi:TonB family protein